jgi:predicted nucleic acid-binding protein
VLILDTGPLVAVTDADDPDHAACDEPLDTDPGPLVTTALVIAEAGFLIDRQVGPHAEAALVADIVEGGIVVESLTTLDHRHFRVVRPAHLPTFTLVP